MFTTAWLFTTTYSKIRSILKKYRTKVNKAGSRTSELVISQLRFAIVSISFFENEKWNRVANTICTTIQSIREI